MICTKLQSLSAWVVIVVLTSILYVHALGPDPAALGDSAAPGRLLAQTALRAPLSAGWQAARPGQLQPLPPAARAPLAVPAKANAPQARPAPLVIPLPKATPAYKHTFHVLTDHPEITDQYDDIIQEHAIRYQLDPRLVKAIIAAESEFSSSAVSPRNARGLMQILPETAAGLGFRREELHDPAANIHAGTAYLAELYSIAWKKYRLKGVGYRDAPLWVIQRIIAAYNAGPRAMGRNSWMRQTRNYVRKVLLFYRSDVSEFRGDLSRSAQKRSPVMPLHSYGTLH